MQQPDPRAFLWDAAEAARAIEGHTAGWTPSLCRLCAGKRGGRVVRFLSPVSTASQAVRFSKGLSTAGGDL